MTTVGLNAALADRRLANRARSVVDAAASIEAVIGESWLTRLDQDAADAYAVIDRSLESITQWATSIPRLGDVYEYLARLEVRSVGGHVETIGTTDHRVRGAYYTPNELAVEACRAISLAPGMSVADLSCGTGAFLVAALESVKDPLLLHGVDVDPLAVIIARIEIAVAAGDLEVARDLDANFTVGNPLLAPTLAAEHGRCQLFDDGFVYHLDQGVATNGFDAIVGNPPWQKIRLEERRFFRPFASQVVAATTKRERTAAIAALEQESPALFRYYQEHLAMISRARELIGADPRFASTSKGELNSYALFAELAVQAGDTVGILVKTALFTTRAHSPFLHRMLSEGRLRAVYDFVNVGRVFDIDSRERFSLMVAGPQRHAGSVEFVAGLRRPDDLRSAKPVTLSSTNLWQLNRVTGVLPNTSDHSILELLLSITDQNSAFDDQYPNARFGRLVHLTAHAAFIHRQPRPDRLSVYEGKFIEQYEGRFATFEGVSSADLYTSKARAVVTTDEQRADPTFEPTVRYFIERTFWDGLTERHDAAWSLIWRNTTSATNRRTVLATVLPHMPSTQSIQLLQLGDGTERDLALLLAVMNSAVFDFAIRQRLNGIDVTSTIIRQGPVPPRQRWKQDVVVGLRNVETLGDFVLTRAAALLANDARLEGFVGHIQPKLTASTSHERRQLQLEIDAGVALAFGLDQAQFQSIIETMPRDFNERDKRYVLEQLSVLSQ
jgi:hypothetical protein